MFVSRSSTGVLRSVPAQLRAAGSRSLSTGASSIPQAALNETAPVASITVAVRAGPRFESQAGVAHALKNFAFKSTKERSALRIVREAELNGGVLSASLNREHLLLTAEFLKGDEKHFADLLAEVVGNAKYCRHEFNEDVIPSIVADCEQAAQDPVATGIDTLFSYAYRNRGVGSSLFASPSSPVTVEQVRSYAAQVMNSNNLAVVSSGLSQDVLGSLVSKSFAGVPAGSAAEAVPSKYFGGDYRGAITDSHGHALPVDHFFLAFEGAPLLKAAPLFVLESLLGGEASVKWSTGLSPLAQINGAKAHAFNASLQDTGLFGIHVSAPSAKIAEAAKAAAQELTKVANGVSSEDITKAVAKAKFVAAQNYEGSRVSSHESVAAGLLNGSETSLSAVLSHLDAVKADDVASAAQALLKSKPTSVALGDVKQLPYADELL
ncbi:Similar to S.cerevisiae protein QCR2 (Subunit 2 of ubiquinol cytochrome-c reductase (Complex III)) [Malassezia sympodialis ATCC 42132]|uniref:Cytochrome b-c1 complex subunit 2, mitochondrial n=1 Tax=Malassezia sympodialis (strain ATCC 42132) TaxID=1230383 RepID=A0A1M8A8R7_MALS4|nr:Similar to S.cerevisiae protein QCR2 (Subunit 2 of ubiquinol cytochrome-c reductase (Complex III)) [Malassezia sympodialis ATCC 42132]